MQKRLVAAPEQRSVTEESWLDLEAMAQVELTSEDPAQPIEGAFIDIGFDQEVGDHDCGPRHMCGTQVRLDTLADAGGAARFDASEKLQQVG